MSNLLRSEPTASSESASTHDGRSLNMSIRSMKTSHHSLHRTGPQTRGAGTKLKSGPSQDNKSVLNVFLTFAYLLFQTFKTSILDIFAPFFRVCAWISIFVCQLNACLFPAAGISCTAKHLHAWTSRNTWNECKRNDGKKESARR